MPYLFKYRKSYPVIHYSRSTTEIKLLDFDGFCISTEDYENCCQLNDSIFIVTKIFSDNNVLYVRGNKYSNTR